MSQAIHIAKSAEVGGATVAAVCGVCKWLADNHDFIASLGIIGGFGIALLGWMTSLYFKRREDIRLERLARLQMARGGDLLK